MACLAYQWIKWLLHPHTPSLSPLPARGMFRFGDMVSLSLCLKAKNKEFGGENPIGFHLQTSLIQFTCWTHHTSHEGWWVSTNGITWSIGIRLITISFLLFNYYFCVNLISMRILTNRCFWVVIKWVWERICSPISIMLSIWKITSVPIWKKVFLF